MQSAPPPAIDHSRAVERTAKSVIPQLPGERKAPVVSVASPIAVVAAVAPVAIGVAHRKRDDARLFGCRPSSFVTDAPTGRHHLEIDDPRLELHGRLQRNRALDFGRRIQTVQYEAGPPDIEKRLGMLQYRA